MHDGRNAWAAVHLAVNSSRPLPLGTKILSRIDRPLLGETSAATGSSSTGARSRRRSMQADPALAAVAAFETAFAITLEPVNNVICLHTWGNEECCVARGTDEAFLYAAAGWQHHCHRAGAAQGDYLIIEEVIGPLDRCCGRRRSGAPPARDDRQEPEPPTSDPLFSNQLLPGGVVQKRHRRRPAAAASARALAGRRPAAAPVLHLGEACRTGRWSTTSR